ncbi:MAG: hypothetical protein ACOVS5_15755 [Oligoflexus sp.]
MPSWILRLTCPVWISAAVTELWEYVGKDVEVFDGASDIVPVEVGQTSSAVQLLASNPLRRGATVYNSSTARLALGLGSVPSFAGVFIILDPGAYYELPYGFTGVVHGLWAVGGSGLAEVNEFV